MALLLVIGLWALAPIIHHARACDEACYELETQQKATDRVFQLRKLEKGNKGNKEKNRFKRKAREDKCKMMNESLEKMEPGAGLTMPAVFFMIEGRGVGVCCRSQSG